MPAVHRFRPLGVAYQQRVVVYVVIDLFRLPGAYDIRIERSDYYQSGDLLLLQLSCQYLQDLAAYIGEIVLEIVDLLGPYLIGLYVERVGAAQPAHVGDHVEEQSYVVGARGEIESYLGGVLVLLEVYGHAGEKPVIKNGTLSDSVLDQDSVFIERTVRQSAGQSQRRDIDHTLFLFMYE